MITPRFVMRLDCSDTTKNNERNIKQYNIASTLRLRGHNFIYLVIYLTRMRQLASLLCLLTLEPESRGMWLAFSSCELYSMFSLY